MSHRVSDAARARSPSPHLAVRVSVKLGRLSTVGAKPSPPAHCSTTRAKGTPAQLHGAGRPNKWNGGRRAPSTTWGRYRHHHLTSAPHPRLRPPIVPAGRSTGWAFRAGTSVLATRALRTPPTPPRLEQFQCYNTCAVAAKPFISPEAWRTAIGCARTGTGDRAGGTRHGERACRRLRSSTSPSATTGSSGRKSACRAGKRAIDLRHQRGRER